MAEMKCCMMSCLFSAGDPGVQQGSCSHRKESKPLNSRSSSLFLQNYFPTYPVEADSCKDHSAPLAAMVNTCYKAAGNMLPNFIAVNFYMVYLFVYGFNLVGPSLRMTMMTSPFSFNIEGNFMQRSDGGGVFDIADKMNGHTLCGCSTITACQVCLC